MVVESINGPQVANWGWGTWSTHIVPQLWESGLVEKGCLYTLFIFFMGGTWHTNMR